MKIIKLKEAHPDMERFLTKHDPEIPGRIYNFDGFFFCQFDPNDQCVFLGTHEKEDNGEVRLDKLFICLVKTTVDTDPRPQLVLFLIDEDTNTITDAMRLEATVNNINIVKILLEKGMAEVVKRKLGYDIFSKYEPYGTLEQTAKYIENLKID